MSKDILDYQLLVQEALRGVIHTVLKKIERDGRLPGGHHFYITFRTGHPGVKVSPAIMTRYPEEMTIVIQHQYWDLKVNEDDFQITLSFNNMPEKLSIPYVAVKNFFDPSTRFGLQFTVAEDAAPAASGAPKEEAAPGEERKPGEVVSLDQFRKK